MTVYKKAATTSAVNADASTNTFTPRTTDPVAAAGRPVRRCSRPGVDGQNRS